MYPISKPLFFLFFFLTFTNINAQTTAKNTEVDASITHSILIDINAYRKNYQLPPLQEDSRISSVAKSHALNMAKHRVSFGHTYFLKRVATIKSQIKSADTAAENVAYNYKDAHDVVNNWILSSGHRKNIVGNYNLTGIGIARDAKGSLYFTQIFIKTGSTKYVPKARSLPHFSIGPLFNRIMS
jgi:uncharacterized protein YkwD